MTNPNSTHRKPPSSLRLVKMARRHLPEILEIEQLCFSETWREVDFLRLIDLPDALCLVAMESGQVIGYSCLWVVIESSELGNLAVHPDFQRLGVGARLLERNLDVCRKRGVAAVFLEVRASNQQAISLYERHGFQRIGLRKRYYAKPVEDAVIMKACL